MGSPVKHKPVKLITSIIYREEKHLKEAEKKLKDLYGDTESREFISPFDYTDYYYEEMGRPLYRKIFCFKRPVDPEEIFNVKKRTNAMEDVFSSEGKRNVNIDPGYITDAKVVLLTTKDYTHRVYLADSIFAEVTLFYQDGSFRAWPWTYPDYASEDLKSYFNRIREEYITGESALC